MMLNDYVEQGIKIFPCSAATKRPLIKGWQEQATTDPEIIRDWWTQWPGAMIGVPTGNGIWVLDLDVKSGGMDWYTRHAEQIPRTRMVGTPSGGVHLYFKGNVRNSVSTIAHGVDTRGQGGYVIGPGSARREDGKAYVLITDEPIAEPGEFLGALVSTLGARELPARRLQDGETRAMEGARNSSLASLAGRYRAVGLSEEEMLPLLLEVNQTRCDPPLEDEEVATIAWSVSRYEPDPAAVKAAETITTGVVPEPTTFGLQLAGALKALSGSHEPEPEKVQPSLTPLMDLAIEDDAEWDDAVLAPPCLVENYLYQDVAQLVAPGGVGKTTLLLYEAVQIALGRPLWGLAVLTPGKTVILTKEDSRERLVARLREICKAMELTPEEIQEVRRSVLIEDLSGRMDMRFAALNPTTRQIERTGAADMILDAYCRGLPPVQLIIDPMVSFGAGEANVNDNEQAIVETARRIIRNAPMCVRFVHHTGKSNAREQTLDMYSGRGGSAMADGSRMTTVLADYGSGARNLAPPPEDWATMVDMGKGQILYHNRAKLQYAPRQPMLMILRRDWSYDYHVVTMEDAKQAEDGTLTTDRNFIAWLIEEHKADRQPDLKSITTLIRGGRVPGVPKMSLVDAQAMVSALLASGDLVVYNGALTPQARSD